MLKVQLVLVSNRIKLFSGWFDRHFTNVVHFALLEQGLKAVHHVVKASGLDLALTPPG